jgi:hypothetical protein
MTDHLIKVTFVGELVHAEPNPLPRRDATPPGDVVRPRDRVIWSFDLSRRLTVIFVGFRDLPSGTFQPSADPLGPLSSVTLGSGQLVGEIRQDVPQDINQARRFFYKLVDEHGVPLGWDNPVEVDLINGGGIDIPRTPP